MMEVSKEDFEISFGVCSSVTGRKCKKGNLKHFVSIEAFLY
jgi:hypothetical protein